MVFLVITWSILGHRAGKLRWWKPFNIAIFLCGFAAAVYITVYSRETGTYEVILTPFHSFVEAKENGEIYRSMLMNVFLFVPLGLTLPNALPRKWHHAMSEWLTILFGFTFSAIIEWCQYRYGLGRCEVDDVIMNTFGAVIGLSSYVIVKMLERNMKRKFQ
jgi:glycopeptide antibiotics resistance protein